MIAIDFQVDPIYRLAPVWAKLTVSLTAKMADNEDDSGLTRTITAAELPGVAAQPIASHCTQPGDALASAPAPQIIQTEESSQTGDSSQTISGDESGQPKESLPAASRAPLAEFLQSCTDEQSILVGTEFTSLGPDLVNTTIIYVQPDGSLVEGSGLTAEEQQALLDQLTKQQIVQVSDTEAAQLLQQSQLVKPIPMPNAALDPSQLQQVINQVHKSQQQVQVSLQTPKQVQFSQQGLKQIQVSQQNLKTMTQNNASQQLKSVAQQVAMQTSSSAQVVQKKVGQQELSFSLLITKSVIKLLLLGNI